MTMKEPSDTAHESLEKKHDMDLEDALDLAGVGRYQYFHCVLMLTTLEAAIFEIIGSAFILPAAACDLGLSDEMRGLIACIPSIGIILTTPFWGRLADKYGRKPVLTATRACAGLAGLMAALMPNLLTFAICQFIASLFLTSPSSLGFAYAGEMVPRKQRDRAVLICSGLLSFLAALCPILAWIVLSFNWQFYVGTLSLRPWRLLTAVYAVPLILTAIWMTQAKESPKFLVSTDKPEQALEVLRHIFVKNTGLPVEEYSVISLKTLENDSELEVSLQRKNDSLLALLKPPHLKWIALTGFLMFGLISVLNGLYLFSPDTINKVMRGQNLEEGTLCVLMKHSLNQDSSKSCVDTISHDSFLVIVVASVVYGLIVTLVSFCPIGKKKLLIGTFGVVGISCLLAGVVTNKIVAAMAMSALQLTSLGPGPLAAYAVSLFPTSLRGTAVAVVLMFGRIGAIVGANTAGYFLSVACAGTFYGFTAAIFLCAALSALLPKDEISQDGQQK